MATEKKMDESAFGAIAKEITAYGELIRTNQDEKQAAMDEFDKEKKRYRMGKISKKALISSSKKVNKEISRLDKSIRKDIFRLSKVSQQAKKFAKRQAPKSFRATLAGMRHPSKKVKKKK